MNNPFTIYVVARQESIDKTIVKTNVISSFSFPNDDNMQLNKLFKDRLPYKMSIGEDLRVAGKNETIRFFEDWLDYNGLSAISRSLVLPLMLYLRGLQNVTLGELYYDCDIDIILKR